MQAIDAVVVAVWTMLPAYVPNNAAVLAGGGHPIDGGRTWRDGKRVLGDGKTWRGTAVGVAAGALLAACLNYLDVGAARALHVALPHFPVVPALTLPVGAMLGDVLASFLKRRTGRERGAAFPLLDQLDFVVVALVLTAVGDYAWFRDTVTPAVVVVVLVLTPVLHVLTNGGAYLLGLKDEPW